MKHPADNAIPFSSKRRQLDVGGFSHDAKVSFTLPSTWYYDPDVYAREHVEYSEHHVHFFQDFVRKALAD